MTDPTDRETDVQRTQHAHLSVHPSVCHMAALIENGWSQYCTIFTRGSHILRWFRRRTRGNNDDL